MQARLPKRAPLASGSPAAGIRRARGAIADARRSRRPRVGIALAGGGPLGGIYEIGALAALADALGGIDLNDLDVYVGVSSGSFVAAGLANDITPLEMAHMFIESEDDREPFNPAMLVTTGIPRISAAGGVGATVAAGVAEAISHAPRQLGSSCSIPAAVPRDSDRSVQ